MALLWQIPVWALASVMAIRLILSPYWIWKETNNKLIETQKSNSSIPKTPLEAFEEYLQKEAEWLEKYLKCPTKNIQARYIWIENTTNGYETACGQIKGQYFQSLVHHHDTLSRGTENEKIIDFLKTQKNTIPSSISKCNT